MTTLRRGFTLIELLLVIGIIAILAAIVIVTLNPAKHIGDQRDSQRRGDVSTILNSVYRYAMENNGKWPATIPTGTPKVICRTKTKSCNNGVNLDILSGVYLVTVPSDPLTPSSGTGTWYTIVQDANGRITVSAPHAEQDANISVTR